MIKKYFETSTEALQISNVIFNTNVSLKNSLICALENFTYKEFKLKKVNKPDNIRIEEIVINNIKYYHFINQNNCDNKVIYVFHGGGYIMPISNNNITGCILYAKYTNADVFLIDYSVTKYAFDKTIYEALDGYNYLLSRYENIYFAGHSAGGGLALGFCLFLRDNNIKLPKKIFLASPWLDVSCSGESYKKNVHIDPFFGNYSNQKLPNYYTKDVKNPYASPIFGNLKNLPNTYVFVSDNEMLLSDSLALEDKMDNVNIHLFHGLWHDFYTHDDTFKEALIVWKIIEEETKL